MKSIIVPETLSFLILYFTDSTSATGTAYILTAGSVNYTTDIVVKSLSGGARGWGGHCAWERVPGALLVREPGTGPGTKREALQLKDGGTIQMDGFGVFKFVATDVVGYLKDFFAAEHSNIPTFEQSNNRTMTFVPHQPNVYMVRQLAKSLGIGEEQTAVSCDALGNLSSASVPATIAWKNVRGPVLFSGFGGGLSVSIGAVEIDEDCKLAVVEV